MIFQNLFKSEFIIPFCSIIGGFLIQLSIGAVYVIQCDYGLNFLNNISLIFGFAMFGLSASMGFSGYMETRINPCIIILTGSLIMNSGNIMTTYTQISAYAALTYGFICGLGGGMIYSLCLSSAAKLFTRFLGLIFGVMVSGFPLGPIIIHFIDTKMEQKFFVNGMVILGIQLFGLIFIRISQIKYPKKEIDSNQELFQEDNNDLNTINANEDKAIAPHQMIFQFNFWIIWLVFALNSFGTILILQLHSILELNPKTGINISILQSQSTIYSYSFSGFIGRIIWGGVMDFFPSKVVFMFLCLGSSIIYVLLARYLSDIIYYQVITSVCFAWLSGNFSIIPIFVIERFGIKNFAANHGIMWTSYACSGILTAIFLHKMGNNLTSTLYTFCAFSILSLLLLLTYRSKSKRSNRKILKFFID